MKTSLSLRWFIIQSLKNLLFSLFILFAFNLYGSSKTRVLPEAEVLEASSGSVEDILRSMTLSQEIGDNYPDTVKVKLGKNPNKIEIDALKDFIENKGAYKNSTVPNSKKSILLTRYHVDLEEVADLLIEAKKKGFARIQLVTDFSYSMNSESIPDRPFDNVPTTDKVKDDTPAGKVIRRLLDAGFELNDARFGISGPLLTPSGEDTITPLMHQKELLLITEEGTPNQRIHTFFGTANMSSGNRYNRLFESTDPHLSEAFLRHTESMIETFSNGGKISDIPDFIPQRVAYPDGTFFELAFSDGKFNPNDRIVRLLERSVSDSKNFVIDEVIFSHFVFTHMKTFDAYRSAIKENPAMKTFAVFDEKFVQPYSWGISPAFAGHAAQRPYGPDAYPLAARDLSNFEGYMYLRGIPGIEDVNPRGPPVARHLWHDKTTIISVVENGEKWTYIFTGSLNASSASRNAESQILLKMKTNSPWVSAFKKSIKGIKTAEKEYLTPLKTGVFRSWVAWFINKSALDIDPVLSTRIQSAFERGNIDLAFRYLYDLSDPNDLEVLRRLDDLKIFSEWYLDKMIAPMESPGIPASRVTAAGQALMAENQGKRARMLSFAVWSPEDSKEMIEERARDLDTTIMKKVHGNLSGKQNCREAIQLLLAI